MRFKGCLFESHQSHICTKIYFTKSLSSNSKMAELNIQCLCVHKVFTSDSFWHMLSSQPSSGGISGINTQSAPQASALTSARYLHIHTVKTFHVLAWHIVFAPTYGNCFLDFSGLLIVLLYFFVISMATQYLLNSVVKVFPTRNVFPSPPTQKSSGGWNRKQKLENR